MKREPVEGATTTQSDQELLLSLLQKPGVADLLKSVGSGTHELLMQSNSLYNEFVKYQSVEEEVAV